MIGKNGKDVEAIGFGALAIAYVSYGATIVWQAIRSCFGSGYWINGKPWINEEPWKNN